MVEDILGRVSEEQEDLVDLFDPLDPEPPALGLGTIVLEEEAGLAQPKLAGSLPSPFGGGKPERYAGDVRREAALLRAKAISSLRRMIGAFNGIDDDGGQNAVVRELQHARLGQARGRT